MSYKYNGVDIQDYLSSGTTNNEGYVGFPGINSNHSVVSQYAVPGYYKDTNINIVSNKICKYADHANSVNSQPVPSWCNKVRIIMIGAGGGGGSGGAGQVNTDGSDDGAGGGGGGGACGMVCVFEKLVSPSSLYNVTIGDGGIGGTYSYSGGNNGSSGNSTTFTIGNNSVTVNSGLGGNKGGSRYGNNGDLGGGNGGSIATQSAYANYTPIISITNNTYSYVNTGNSFIYSVQDNLYTPASAGNSGTQNRNVSTTSGGTGGSGGYLKANGLLGDFVNKGKGGSGGNGWNENTGNDGSAGTKGFIKVYFLKG